MHFCMASTLQVCSPLILWKDEWPLFRMTYRELYFPMITLEIIWTPVEKPRTLSWREGTSLKQQKFWPKSGQSW